MEIYSDTPENLPTYLKKFLVKHCSGFIDILHLLPFYPYSSDNGFSVIDYLKVDEELGDWSHIRDLSPPFSLAFDGVFNHISAKSRWFEDFLSGEEYAQDYFISPDPKADLSPVTRPRSTPLLTPYPTSTGEKYLWTTFSADQIDLNYKSPQLLLVIIQVFYFI